MGLLSLLLKCARNRRCDMHYKAHCVDEMWKQWRIESRKEKARRIQTTKNEEVTTLAKVGNIKTKEEENDGGNVKDKKGKNK